MNTIKLDAKNMDLLLNSEDEKARDINGKEVTLIHEHLDYKSVCDGTELKSYTVMDNEGNTFTAQLTVASLEHLIDLPYYVEMYPSKKHVIVTKTITYRFIAQ